MHGIILQVTIRQLNLIVRKFNTKLIICYKPVANTLSAWQHLSPQSHENTF